MIIDVHYHMIGSRDWWSDTLWNYLGLMIGRLMERFGKQVSPQMVQEEILPGYLDPDGSRLIRHMEAHGVDVAVICVVDNGIGFGDGKVPIEEQNRIVAEMARQYPGRVIPFAGIDPRRSGAPQLFEKCVEQWGVRGLKFHPDAGYYPNGKEAYALLEIAEKNGLTLLTHTGPLPPPSRGKFAHPIHLDDLGVDFPTLKVIAAHMGDYWWRDWAAISHFRPNLFGDLAEWQFPAFQKYEKFCRDLREAIDTAGIEKVVFGSDSPVFEPATPMRDWLKILQELPQNSPPEAKFTQAEVEAMLGGNAQRILGL
ncbi:MAG: amidohydrolase [Candidatus Tectomicrobia bacterium]|uniref:Amidohydrolase n=1 Tax=Tectimicrobiota bacterium TaxID=2528274 RepID=A0A932CN22_UNCTE|nr:amidohydrolase [Candidatus Tectomicrobia bacterium]